VRKGLLVVVFAAVTATACQHPTTTTAPNPLTPDSAASAPVAVPATTRPAKSNTNNTTSTTTTRQGGIEGLPVDALTLNVGECFNKYSFLQSFQPVDVTTRRPCDQPHDAEVFLKVNYPGADLTTPFPGKEKLVSDAIKICYQSFTDFVGSPFETSTYQLSYLVPPKERWEDPVENLRAVICYLTGPTKATKLTGTARASKK
jgi:hypothetical protein